MLLLPLMPSMPVGDFASRCAGDLVQGDFTAKNSYLYISTPDWSVAVLHPCFGARSIKIRSQHRLQGRPDLREQHKMTPVLNGCHLV